MPAQPARPNPGIVEDPLWGRPRRWWTPWRSWPAHNLVAHPLGELVYLVTVGRAGRFANWLHDVTLPDHEPGTGRG